MKAGLSLLLLLVLAVPGWGQTPAALHVRIERVQNRATLMLDLSSAKPLTVEGIGFVQLSNAAGGFWAPFSLKDFKPIKANTTSLLAIDAAHARRGLDLCNLRWGRMIDGPWPFRPFSIVPSGRYEVSVVVEQEDRRRIESNKVPYQIRVP